MLTSCSKSNCNTTSTCYKGKPIDFFLQWSQQYIQVNWKIKLVINAKLTNSLLEMGQRVQRALMFGMQNLHVVLDSKIAWPLHVSYWWMNYFFVAHIGIENIGLPWIFLFYLLSCSSPSYSVIKNNGSFIDGAVLWIDVIFSYRIRSFRTFSTIWWCTQCESEIILAMAFLPVASGTFGAFETLLHSYILYRSWITQATIWMLHIWWAWSSFTNYFAT